MVVCRSKKVFCRCVDLVGTSHALKGLLRSVTVCSRPRLVQVGSSLVEVLVAVSIFALIGLSATRSAMSSIRYQKNVEVSNIARNLAISKAETLSGVRIDLLTTASGGTESDLSVPGHTIKFTRSTTVSVNSDGSRTISVVITSSSPLLLSPVSYSTRFAPWES